MTERRYQERAVDDEDTEGNRKAPLTTDDDEDTEGNRRAPLATDDDDDTEGNKRTHQ